jgi:hypothetical protein
MKIYLGKSGYNGFFGYNGYNGFLVFLTFFDMFEDEKNLDAIMFMESSFRQPHWDMIMS